jgi:hypothetical protein
MYTRASKDDILLDQNKMAALFFSELDVFCLFDARAAEFAVVLLPKLPVHSSGGDVLCLIRKTLASHRQMYQGQNSGISMMI